MTTILNQNEDKREYGFEVSVECGGGTINWAQKLGLFNNYNELNSLGEGAEEIYFMPSFGTIYSPFWKNDVKGAIIGMNFNTKKQNILKALLNSITYRLYDNVKD